MIVMKPSMINALSEDSCS